MVAATTAFVAAVLLRGWRLRCWRGPLGACGSEIREGPLPRSVPLKRSASHSYPTLEAARTTYDEGFARAARTLAPPPPEGIGDQFHCPTPGNGTLWLRRLNVIVQAAWSGGREQAVAIGRRVDNILVSNSAVCPGGLRVPVPKIECSVPTRVPLGELFEVRYGTTDGAMVRTEANSELHSSGSMPVLARELGPLKLTLRFASSMNVMFEQHLEVEVVRPEDLAEPRQPQAWRWPGMALQFLREPTHKWGSEPVAVKLLPPPTREQPVAGGT